jgi:two-component system NtrC family response regulator
MERIETATALAPRALKDAPTDTSGKNDNRFILSDGSMIVGQSPSLKSVIDTVRRVAPTQASVLITGESGTGKELIAQAIHEHSRRAGKPFVKVNLGGISTTLFESELFGHKKGAFTDAKSNRTGRFEMAEGGTIFLDEIGELELASQVKLLRVLQDQTYEVLGDSQPRRADVRVVCATNRDLRQMVTEKTFREDLFYRINLIHIHLPPLRERQEDIPLLVEHFVRQTAAANGLQNITATKEAVRYLQSLSFYGNIRELKNLVERTLLMSPDQEIVTADDFKANLQPDTRLHPGTPSSGIQGNTLEEIERSTIEASVKRHGGNLTMVAKELGISRGALYRKMEKHRL